MSCGLPGEIDDERQRRRSGSRRSRTRRRRCPARRSRARAGSAPTTHQVQAPSSRMKSRIIDVPPAAGAPRHRGRAGGATASSPKDALAISAMPASEPISAAASIGSISTLLVRRAGERLQRLGVALRDEIVDRLHVALGDRLRRPSRSPCASASAERSRASASRKAASRRPSACRISACFSPSALRISDAREPSASRICARFSRSAFICRRHRRRRGRAAA